jgi:dipeptidyl aminopeptidase/acylaminoacyl peptidase
MSSETHSTSNSDDRTRNQTSSGNKGQADKPESRSRWSRLVRWVVRRLVVAIAALTLGGLALQLGCQHWVEARVFVFPTPGTPETPDGLEDVWFESDPGVNLHGWWVPARAADDDGDGLAPTVLHVHGNAGHLGDHVLFTEWLADAGFNVMLFDYRGYGRSDQGPRRPARRELIADTNAALDAVLARSDVDPARVAVFGFSLGGSVSLAGLVDRSEPAAFVAAAPFSTWRGVARDHAGILGRLLIGSGPEPIDGIAKLGERPALLVHGTDDRIVRVHHVDVFEKAADDAGTQLTVLRVPNADHNDLLVDHPRVRMRIAEFLAEALSG